MRTVIALLLALSAGAHAADSKPPVLPPQAERLAADLASELAHLCPPAQPGDQAAFERCRRGLFQDSLLKRSFMRCALWGRRAPDVATPLKETTLTQFAPDVLTGMYLPLFMFNGRYTVEYEAREDMFVVRLETAFRNRLAGRSGRARAASRAWHPRRAGRVSRPARARRGFPEECRGPPRRRAAARSA